MKMSECIAIVLIDFIIFTGCGSNTGQQDTQSQREDGAYKLNIPLTGSLQNPAFSPDGENIVFTQFKNGYNKEPSDLYTYNLTTKKLTLIVSNGSANVNLPGSSWNQNTNSIVYSSSQEPHDEIYTVKADAPHHTMQVTQRDAYVAYEPSFNPSGDEIVFESHILDVEENGVIFKHQLNTSAYIPLTDLSGDARQPNWSPMGDKILYQKFMDGHWDIYTINTNGNNAENITQGQGNSTDAIFSYDGQSIIYSSDYHANIANIYSVNLSSKSYTQLTNSNTYNGAPSLAPNGKTLIFESSKNDPDNSAGTSIWLLNL